MDLSREWIPRAFAIALAGWLIQGLVARLWLTDSWLVAVGFGALGAVIGLAVLFAASRSTPEREITAWLRAARRGELLPLVGPGIRFDRFAPATDRLLAEAEALARADGQSVVELEHLLLAYLELERRDHPALTVLARRSLEMRSEVRASELPPRLGLSHAVIRALEFAHGEAIGARADRIAPVHVLRGIGGYLADPFEEGPPRPFREAIRQELRSILEEPAGGL